MAELAPKQSFARFRVNCSALPGLGSNGMGDRLLKALSLPKGRPYIIIWEADAQAFDRLTPGSASLHWVMLEFMGNSNTGSLLHAPT